MLAVALILVDNFLILWILYKIFFFSVHTDENTNKPSKRVDGLQIKEYDKPIKQSCLSNVKELLPLFLSEASSI